MTTTTMTQSTTFQVVGLDVEAIRADFPILERRVHGMPLVYLDNAATSQKPRQVIDALTHYYEHTNANVHRGVHTLSEEATAQIRGRARPAWRASSAPAAPRRSSGRGTPARR